MVGWALAAVAVGSTATVAMNSLWQLDLLWGVLIGAATGCLASPLAAIVATRWFVERRGLVTGLLSSAYAGGQLVFLPLLALITRDLGWRWAAGAVALAAALAVPLALSLLRERPADLGLPPFGGTAVEVAPPLANPFAATVQGLALGLRSRTFWLLAGTFFICGATTVGVVGTHLIPAAHDHGIGEVTAASLLAVIGVWIFAAHQLGAASATWAAGAVRTAADSYQPAFLGAGLLGVLAALMILGVSAARRPAQPAAGSV